MKKVRGTVGLAVCLVVASCGSSDRAADPEPPGSSTEPTTESTAAAGDDTAAEIEQEAPDPAEDGSPAPPERLLSSFTDPPETSGDVLVLYGRVLDRAGEPIPDAVVEIWQTDASGVYDHPGDAGTDGRDRTFQFFGSAAADADGWYAFRTILPGQYEPRPRHIHFKAKQEAATLLTSQFYFRDSPDGLASDGLTAGLGDGLELLLLDLETDDGFVSAIGDVVIDLGAGGGREPTPAQGEGPYYPVVDVAGYDNDLTRLR